ncbi:hypothetical protein NLG97_g9196 [Lecanicillium saksenae]|uniref:Uncharacterized protein n=1 Tax=Lecanicillium saksenae TaxID=468837 RepID=A0ACC1QJQ0_9HYPO|nr:hypothetical protein NLG97_g9196 [Lecanicillium saksenae]
MPVPGSVAGVMPSPVATMPMTVPMTAPMAAPMVSPMDNSMPPAPWDAEFNMAPNPADISATFPLQPHHIALPLEETQPLPHPQPTQLQQQFQPQPPLHSQAPLPTQQPPRVQPPPRARQSPLTRSPSLLSEPAPQDQRRRKSRSRQVVTSPFSDCIDTFGRNFSLKRFARPLDGKVNGYIKFSWPQKRDGDKQNSRVIEVTEIDHDGDLSPAMPSAYITKHGNELTIQRRGSSTSTSAMSIISGSESPFSTASTLVMSQAGHYLQSPTGSFSHFLDSDNTEHPRFVPPHFGHVAVMDNMDRKLFKFYLNNWCPGRSVLKGTNLWLTDFAKMHDSVGVLSAIQSLAGIYIHDYLPDEIVRRRVNERFAIAEARLSQLLQDQANLDARESSELITLASLLSMQDIVLTERRLKKPYHPRWLTGFKQGEQMLQLTDPGNRFYKESNVQVDALRLSQSVIVGRAVILAQPMMPLPPIATFDPIAEAARFGFLLYGTKSEMYEIHGGCGFSKRLLHIFSQVAYCSARMLQDGETPIVPVTANMLYGQLVNLHQWSGEYSSWEAAQSKPQPIEWIRKTDETYIVQLPDEMTEVTAEAWRLAGMIYLQCRLLRLPRNHPDVITNMGDLAKSISIMPTSGPVFTAQAPLLPVFLLGLLATVEEHENIAHAWFQQVIRTPVRSSVPPLYETLERIQSWMSTEVPVPAPNMELPRAIAERQPWWERMVSKVQEKETEVLCLT